MAGQQYENPNRRAFLSTVASLLLPELPLLRAHGATAQTADYSPELRDLLAIEQATRGLSSSTQSTAQQLHALSYAIVQNTPNEAISIASKVREGVEVAIPADFVARLKQELPPSQPLRTEFEAVDPSARAALTVSGIVATRVARDSYVTKLPVVSNVSTTGHPLLLKSARFGSGLSGDLRRQWSEVTKIDLDHDVQYLATSLGGATRNLVSSDTFREILSARGQISDSLRRRSVYALNEAFGATLNGARGQYANAVNLMSRGTDSAPKLTLALTAASQTVATVGAVGSFVLDKVLGEPAASRQVAAGIQVVNLLMTLGAMYATGGLGLLATGQGLVGGLNAVGSLFGSGSSNDFSSQMLSQISQQILELQRQMHERFDRVEKLQQETLKLLTEIRTELSKSRLDVKGALSDLTNLFMNARREDKLEAFERDKAAAQEFVKRAHGSSAPSGDAVEETLYNLIRYAISRALAADQVFVAKPGELRSVLDTSRAPQEITTDTGLDLLRRACTTLSLRVNRKFEYAINPTEWARGVQAFLELRSNFPALQGKFERDEERAWQFGIEIRDYILEACSSENVERAIETLRRTQREFQQSLIDYLKPPHAPKVSPTIGELPMPVLGLNLNAEQAKADKRKKVFLSVYKTFTDPHNHTPATDQFIPLSYDIIEAAKALGAISLSQPTRRDVYRLGGGRRTVDGTIDIYKVRGNGTNEDLGQIAEVKIGKPPVTAWHFAAPSESGVREFLLKICKQADFSKFIADRLKDMRLDQSSEGAKILRQQTLFDECLAAFVVFVAFLSWRVTGLPDSIPNSRIAMLLPASAVEVTNLLARLAEKVTADDLPLLQPVAGLKDF
jgi:hypothetical protein